jgi:hypothetical protein
MAAASEWLSGWFRKTDDPPAEHAATTVALTGGEGEQEPVVVWEAANLLEAQVVKGRLASEGIPALIRGEALGAIYGLTTGGLAAADVLVPAPLAEKALALLNDEEPWDEEEADES